MGRAGKKPNPTWADVTCAGRKATARILIQAVWGMANATDLSNDDINGVIEYMHEQQDSFNQGYMNYKDVVKTLKDERGIDLTGVENILHKK